LARVHVRSSAVRYGRSLCPVTGCHASTVLF
jgi:hypothetical protein